MDPVPEHSSRREILTRGLSLGGISLLEGTPGQSVFDLSPAEKLQLVEDLWDDLAGTPEAVPVHDWQKAGLARRKANLLKTPASGFSWEEVKLRARGRHGR